MTLIDRFHVPHYYRQETGVQGGRVRVLEDRCDACGLCVRVCPASALVLVDRTRPLRKGKKTISRVMAMSGAYECVACGDCAAVCPNDACHVSRQMHADRSLFKTINKGPLSLPRLFGNLE